MSPLEPRLVRIPRSLLHVGLDDLANLGVPFSARDALRALLADLPLVPGGSDSTLLLGPARVSLPCLAVLARHVGQGLRDHNVHLMHDREHLRTDRLKLIFLDGDALASLVADGDPRVLDEAVLCASGAPAAMHPLLAKRASAGRASFVALGDVPPALATWRRVQLVRSEPEVSPS